MTQSMIPPDQFAALVAQASDDDLRKGMEENREELLSEIFRRMPDSFDAARASDVSAVIHWEITGAPNGEVDRWQLTMHEGRCTCVRDGEDEPDVVYRVDPVDFVKLITGVEHGPRMFVFGKLRIRGNLLLAARVQGFFTLPDAKAAEPAG